MTKAHIKLAVDTPQPRRDLADAIARHAAAVGHQTRVAATAEHARQTLYSTMDQIETAETALKTAKANEGERLAADALGEATDILSVADAEAALARARNDLSVAQATRSALEQRLRGEEAEIERARRVLDEAVREVVRLEVPVADMLAAALQLQEQLIGKRIVLRQLYKSSCIPSDSVKAIESFLRDAALPAGAGVVEHADFDRHAAAVPWRNVIEQLHMDAEAKLPPV